MTVSLRDFVRQTLQDILGGIADVQKDEELGRHVAPWGIGAIEYPPDSGLIRKGPFTATVVKFDIGVSAESTDKAGGHGGLKVAVFNAGVTGEVQTRNTATNRIQFSVPISLPPGDGDPADPEKRRS